MLEITIKSDEMWDEIHEKFIAPKEFTLQLEHSLVSLSKWESKWHKPFISKTEMSAEEALDYVKCMTITRNVDPDIYNHLTTENMNEIKEYIDAPMTATRINDRNKGGRGEQITAEILYYYMIAFNIPDRFEKWHLNRLLTLIKVCDIKNRPGKKMSQNEVMSQNKALNAARRKKLNSKG